MKKEFDTMIFIGRFQPFTRAHEFVIRTALEKTENLTLILGSSFSPRTEKNPWTFEERMEMIYNTFPEDNIDCYPVMDYPYNDSKWISAVQEAIEFSMAGRSGRTGLIGHAKDESSYYLKMFPHFESVDVSNFEGINATDVRNMIFATTSEGYEWDKWKSLVPESTATLVEAQWNAPDSELKSIIMNERRFIKSFKESWKDAPYPPTFNTSDAVVVCSGHILLVKRGAYPGKGLWALPGGYINQNESFLDSSIRELREETRLKVPDPVLRGSISGSEIFDYPKRSPRGRVITKAFFFDLGNQTKLPKVRGGDDAAMASWVKLNDIDPEKMFEDHIHIIDHFMGIL